LADLLQALAEPEQQSSDAAVTPERRPALRVIRRPFGGLPLRPARRNVEIPETVVTQASLQRDTLYRRLLGVADVLSAALAVVLGIAVFGNASLSPLLVLAIPGVLLVGKITKLYDRDEHVLKKTTLDEAPDLFRVAALYTLIVSISANWLIYGHLGGNQALALWVLLFVSMLVTRSAARRLARAVGPEERCLVLGDAAAASWISHKLAGNAGIKASVVGRVPFEPENAGSNGSGVLGTFDSLGIVLAEHDVDRVVIAPATSDQEHMLDAIRLVKALGVKVSVLPRLFEVIGSSVEFDDIDGVTLLGVRRYGLSRSSEALKRSLDLVVAGLALLVLGPIMLLLALAIKLDTRGPVLFRQRRMGRMNQPFEMFKFRTMVDGADALKESLAARNEAGGGLFKIENDPRITRVGAFLRKTSLDELPQLLNVLRGDMAVVGPRPLVIDEDARIEGWQRRRLLLPPGMTGLWQVFGSARIPMPEMVKIDYLYGANWSLWLDVKILLRTVPFVLGRRGL
jgi:exopolysaccharide biosynthesis polyprenyl glycosylphosphotransferase